MGERERHIKQLGDQAAQVTATNGRLQRQSHADREQLDELTARVKELEQELHASRVREASSQERINRLESLQVS